jgi:hypothetical protein
METRLGNAEQRERIRDTVLFHGHPLVSALHPTTIEITTEESLTENGDCIIGVGAEKGCAGLSDAIKRGLRCEASQITIRLVVGSSTFSVRGQGDPRLSLADVHDIVIRKSGFISDRTIAVRADCAAKDIPRRMVAELRRPDTLGRMEVEVG